MQKFYNIKLAKEISDQLEQFCEESGMSKNYCDREDSIEVF